MGKTTKIERLPKTHLTWSIERASGKCPMCSGKTLLLCRSSFWEVHRDSTIEAVGEDAYEESYSDGVHIEQEEITCHWCPECDRITSLSLNT